MCSIAIKCLGRLQSSRALVRDFASGFVDSADGRSHFTCQLVTRQGAMRQERNQMSVCKHYCPFGGRMSKELHEEGLGEDLAAWVWPYIVSVLPY